MRIPWNYNRVSIICLNCKKKFKVSQYRKTTAQFCSRGCRSKHNLITKRCKQCKNKFIVNKAREAKYNAKFCKYQCYENFKANKRIPKRCLHCKKQFIVPLWQKKRKFCEKVCYSKHQKTYKYIK